MPHSATIPLQRKFSMEEPANIPSDDVWYARSQLFYATSQGTEVSGQVHC